MNQHDIKRLALISAINADIEGMKVANMRREAQGFALAYSENVFFEAAEELRALANKHNEQL